jgi:hypothetical protein
MTMMHMLAPRMIVTVSERRKKKTKTTRRRKRRKSPLRTNVMTTAA